ncbi:hypothetical protein HK104_001220 [Borealophlyctis nickersoniae]|nr:hypothetical protein HK104_001220 [Borealophlyctis nickersoniae]
MHKASSFLKSAFDWAPKANAFWKAAAARCLDRGEFEMAQAFAMRVIGYHEELKDLIDIYECRGRHGELLSLLEASLTLENAHSDIYTELAVLYCKHEPHRLLEHLRIFCQQINIEKIMPICEAAGPTAALVFMYTQCGQYDKAARTVIQHWEETWDHEAFKCLVPKILTMKIYYEAIRAYLEHQPLLLNDLLAVMMPRINHTRAVRACRDFSFESLALVKPYLLAAQSANVRAVNTALHDLWIAAGDHTSLRASIDQFDNFDQIALAQSLEKNSHFEFRLISAELYKKNGKFAKANPGFPRAASGPNPTKVQSGSARKEDARPATSTASTHILPPERVTVLPQSRLEEWFDGDNTESEKPVPANGALLKSSRTPHWPKSRKGPSNHQTPALAPLHLASPSSRISDTAPTIPTATAPAAPATKSVSPTAHTAAAVTTKSVNRTETVPHTAPTSATNVASSTATARYQVQEADPWEWGTLTNMGLHRSVNPNEAVPHSAPPSATKVASSSATAVTSKFMNPTEGVPHRAPASAAKVASSTAAAVTVKPVTSTKVTTSFEPASPGATGSTAMPHALTTATATAVPTKLASTTPSAPATPPASAPAAEEFVKSVLEPSPTKYVPTPYAQWLAESRRTARSRRVLIRNARYSTGPVLLQIMGSRGAFLGHEKSGPVYEFPTMEEAEEAIELAEGLRVGNRCLHAEFYHGRVGT